MSLQSVAWGPAANPATSLVVLCHGVGADGSDLIGLAPHLATALPHAVFAAPDAPDRYTLAPAGRQWFDLSDRTPALLEAGAARARPLLDAFIDAELVRLGLPPDAYALAGFSQGAMMALYAGLRRATAPRAILAFSGALLAPERLAGQRANAAPVLLVHGEADGVVPASRSRDAEAALRADGVAVESLFVPGLGHGIDGAGLAAGVAFLQRAFGSL